MKLKQKINYIGSKYSLLDFIYQNINENVDNLKEKTFCDLFAGTHIVGNFFKDKVKKVISNDIEYYSYCIGCNYILNNESFEYEKYLDELNNLTGIKGNIFNYYSENGTCNRKYFSQKNGMKIDSIRTKIEDYKDNKNLYYFLITSLLEAADKVANTTSVYGAYLKKIKRTADNDLILLPSLFNINENQENEVYNQDANELIKKISGDVLYIDTPYNHRQYGSNYHILNAISKYDFSNEPKGITGLMEYNKSKYCYKNEVYQAFESLIKEAKFNHIFISYNNEGLLEQDDFSDILYKHGNITKYEMSYKTYKADSNRNNKSDNTIEYLFYLDKIGNSMFAEK